MDCVSEGRSIVTAIYYLLPANAVSRLHRIDADELWFFHEGQPLHVHVFEGDGYERLTLGPGDGFETTTSTPCQEGRMVRRL